jgi:hypothetical protein
MYRQAAILTDGHPEQLDIGDLSPAWWSSQLSGTRLKTDCLILATDEPLLWIATMERIDKTFSKPGSPAPNYLANVGGAVAVQRFIDSHEKFIGGNYLYHPLFFTEANYRKFPPFLAFLHRKAVLQGVSISAIYCLIYSGTNYELWKLSYFLDGWPAWHLTAYVTRPVKDSEFPRPLNRSGEGVLVSFLCDFDNGGELEYDFLKLYDQCKDHYETVCSF